MNGMLPKYAHATLAKTDRRVGKNLVKLKKQVLELKENDYLPYIGNYLIHGDYRRGKTWMLHALINHFKKLGEKSIAYVDSPKLYEYFKNNKIWRFDYTWAEYYKDTEILMLDDLGQEYRSGSGFVESNLETFLRWRFAHNRKTFIGTNAGYEKIKEIYGPSFGEFIEGEYLEIPVMGKNISLAKKKELK